MIITRSVYMRNTVDQWLMRRHCYIVTSPERNIEQSETTKIERKQSMYNMHGA
jgi:hypothetical protein